MSIKFELEGWDDCVKKIERLGKVQKKHVTAAVKKSMSPVLKAARAGAPVGATGKLQKGIIMVGEKNKPKAKKVYRIVFDRAYNDVFQKHVENSGRKSTKGGIAYYPFSMEYGFYDKKGVFHDSSAKTGWQAGFVHLALDGKKIEEVVVSEMKKKLDQEIRKEGLA